MLLRAVGGPALLRAGKEALRAVSLREGGGRDHDAKKDEGRRGCGGWWGVAHQAAPHEGGVCGNRERIARAPPPMREAGARGEVSL